MDMKQWILQALDYDAWANRRWADYLTKYKNAERATEVFQHILNAQRIWLERCGVMVEFSKQDEHLGAFAASSAQAWRMFIDQADLDEEITYTTTKGDTFTNTIEQIALHVINHGTYHRGHLRGLAECEGMVDFKDTDLLFFFRE